MSWQDRRDRKKAAAAAAKAAQSGAKASYGYENLIKEALDLHERGEKKKGKFGVEILQQCVEKYKEAEGAFPEEQNSYELHFNLASAYSTLAERLQEIDNPRPTDEIAAALLSACEHYGICVQFSPNSDALNNWGVALTSFAALQQEESSSSSSSSVAAAAEGGGGGGGGKEEILSLYQQAFERFEQGAALDPRDFEIACNYADSLCACALLLDDLQQAAAMFQKGNEMFAHGLTLMQYDCDRVDAMCNWGNALSSWAQRAAECGHAQEALTWYDAALEKLSFVARINNGDPSALANVGEVLRYKAEISPNSAELYQQAISTYESALSLDRANEDALLGIGDCTLDMGRMFCKLQNPEALAYLKRSYESYGAALSRKEDATVHYNAACACSLAGEESRCVTHLERVAALRKEELQSLEKDEDFAAWRATAWFRTFVDQAAAAAAAASAAANVEGGGSASVSTPMQDGTLESSEQMQL